MSEQRVFVTNDRWTKDGRLDPDDEAVLKEAAGDGELVVMNTREAFEAMKVEKPAEFDKFHKVMESTTGRALTFEQLVELSQRAGETFGAFSKLTELMTDHQAKVVRNLRVGEHCTWRAVARSCYIMGWGKWSPASNQLMGMALCKWAAELYGEDYMKVPWN